MSGSNLQLPGPVRWMNTVHLLTAFLGLLGKHKKQITTRRWQPPHIRVETKGGCNDSYSFHLVETLLQSSLRPQSAGSIHSPLTDAPVSTSMLPKAKNLGMFPLSLCCLKEGQPSTQKTTHPHPRPA